MGRVKDHFWEEICAGACDQGDEPDEIEALKIDAELARERYQRALEDKKAKHEPR